MAEAATDAYVGSALTVLNLSVTGSANIEGSGIATVGGDVSFNSVSIASTISVGTTATIEVLEANSATVTNTLSVGGNLNVTGDVSYDAGIANTLTVNDLNFNVGVGTTLTVEDIEFSVGIGSTLTVSELVVIDSLTATGNNQIVIDGDSVITGVVTIGENSITLDGRADQEFIRVGSAQSGPIIAGPNPGTGRSSYIEVSEGLFDSFIRVGLGSTSTFGGDVDIAGNLNIIGDISFDEVNARNANISEQTTTRDLNVTGVATIGFATLTNASVGGALTVYGDLDVVGDITYDEVSGRNLNITGIGTIATADIEDADIGVATVGFLSATSSYVGVLTVSSFNSQGGETSIGDDITTRDLNVTGIATIGFATLTNASVGGALTVYGDLDVVGDITYDEVSGRNLNITGIGTIATADIEFADVGVSTIGFLTATDARVGSALTVNNLFVEGLALINGAPISTEGGPATFTDLTVTNLNYVNASGIALTTGSINVTGSAEISGVSINSGIVTASPTAGIVTYYGDGFNLANLPSATIQSDTAPTERENGDPLQDGDIWFDGLGLRQYTYYFDGSDFRWIDSNPQPAPPQLNFSTDDGVGTIDLYADILNVEGTPNQIETKTGIGSTTVQIGISSSLVLPGDLLLDSTVGVATIDTLFTDNLAVTATLGANNISASSSITAAEFYGDGSNLTGVPATGGEATFSDLLVTGITTLGVTTATSFEASTINATSTLTSGGVDVIVENSTANLDSVVATNNVSAGNSVTALLFYGDGVNLSNLPPSTIVSNTEPATRVNGDALQQGDLWYDTVNGVVSVWGGSQWLSSLPELELRGDAGIGTIAIDSEPLIIDGTTNQINTVAFTDRFKLSLSNVVTISERLVVPQLSVGAAATFTGIISAANLVVNDDFAALNGGEFTGIVTFNNGIDVSGISSIGNIEFNGSNINTRLGVITALSFVGNGSSLTDVEAVLTDKVTVVSDNTDDDFRIPFIINDFGDNRLGLGDTVVDSPRINPSNGKLTTLDTEVRDLTATGITSVGFVTATDALVTGITTLGTLSFGGIETTSGITSDISSVVYSSTDIAQAGTIKSYVDSQIGSANFLQFTDGTTNGRIDLGGSEVFNILAEGNLESSVDGVGLGNTIRINLKDSISVASSVTASTYYGDGSNLTGIGATAIVNGADIEPRNLRVTGVSTFVGVGTFENGLNVSGDTTVGFLTATDVWVSGMITTQDINSLSDRRVKEDIQPIENALIKLDQLNGVTFKFVNTGKASMGVIAQEVEAVFPELISGEFPKSVNYNGLIGALIESVKELKSQNEDLLKRIEKLENDK